MSVAAREVDRHLYRGQMGRLGRLSRIRDAVEATLNNRGGRTVGSGFIVAAVHH